MRLLFSTVAVLTCLLSVAVATAQDRAATPSKGKSVASVSPGQTAIDKAAAANKYIFLFFWNEKGPKTDKAWDVVQPALAKMADKADVVSIQVTDPAEKVLVDKYGLKDAPMPLVLTIAPCSAVTKAFTKTFDEKQLNTAFVSPCTEKCLKALQNNKVVFVCVADNADPQVKVTAPKGVKDFAADAKYKATTEIVTVNARDAKEATFLKEIDVTAKTAPITVFLVPPGAMIGSFRNSTTKETFIEKLVAAQSKKCAGGKCGAGGCGPKE